MEDKEFGSSQGIVVSEPVKSKKPKKMLLALFVVVLLAAVGAAGYFYKTTNDSLKKKSQELSSAYQTIEKFQTIIDENQAQAVGDFIAKENDASLSNSLCGGKPLLMSDVHLNDKFAVFRYLCAERAGPVLIAALKKLPDGSYEFTYGASTGNPNGLPGYIFNSEPEFFGGQYGVKSF